MQLLEHKLGKGAPKVDPATPKFSAIASTILHATPPATEWRFRRGSRPTPTKPATNIILEDFGNKELPDCTTASIGNADQVITEHTGTTREVYDATARGAYWLIASNPPTSGAAMLDAACWFRDTGTLDGILELGVGNAARQRAQAQQAIYELCGVYIGLQLPIAWADNRDVWDDVAGTDGAPNSWGGHAVWAIDFDQTGLWVCTWGGLKRMTWRAYYRYNDEGYALSFKRAARMPLLPSGIPGKQALVELMRAGGHAR